MVVSKTWSNPETAKSAGGLDVSTADTVDETWGDRMASNLDWVAGTAGVINQASQAGGSTNDPTTTSTTYVDMNELSVAVTPEVGTTRLFALLFSTVSNNAASGTTIMALSLDAAAEVSPVQCELTDVNDQTMLVTAMLFESVTAAAHTIKGRWKVGSGTGKLVGVSRRLIVFQLK